MFLFYVCLSVSVRSRLVNQTSGHIIEMPNIVDSKFGKHAFRDSPDRPLKIFRKKAWPWSCDPLNF